MKNENQTPAQRLFEMSLRVRGLAYLLSMHKEPGYTHPDLEDSWEGVGYIVADLANALSELSSALEGTEQDNE
ncbi:MAG: hypothetical protein JNL01_10405 [Bdellovibrionales bacterium]|nr:hypothetical protein [Bdellovibrionales bacterium]